MRMDHADTRQGVRAAAKAVFGQLDGRGVADNNIEDLSVAADINGQFAVDARGGFCQRSCQFVTDEFVAIQFRQV